MGEPTLERGSPRRSRLVSYSCLIAGATALVPAWYGHTGHPWTAFEAGLLLSGFLGLVSGLGVIGWWLRRRREHLDEVFRLLMGLCVFFWAAGQICLGFDSLDGSVGNPDLGDLISAVAVPLGLLAMIWLPRGSISSWAGLRLGLDAFVVGGALTFVLWLRFVPAAPTGLDLEHLGTGVFVLGDCVILAGVLLMSVRDVYLRGWPLVLGVLCYVTADLIGMLSAQQDPIRQAPWISMSVWCLAWPLIAIGIVRFQPNSRFDAEDVRDRHEAAANQVATLVTYAALLSVGFLRDPFGVLGTGARGTRLLAGLIIPVMCVREVIGIRLRLRLTAGLRGQAYRDSLTGLPNRRALVARIAELEKSPVSWVVLTIDLDGFKEVNDRLGHHGGDDLLVTVADALERNRPGEALAARIGGDEFALLSPGDLAQGRELGERLRSAIGHAMNLRAPGLGTSVSIGVGRLVHQDRLVPEQSAQAQPQTRAERGTSAIHVVPGAGNGNADRDQLSGLVESAAALRAAKAGGRNAVQTYAGPVSQARERRLLLEKRLRLAVQNRSIVTYGQPIVDLATGKLAGFESLARWTDDELGMVPPDEFIAVAEETGLVVALGEHLMEETLEAATAAGVFEAGLTLSINASPIQLRVSGYVEIIRYHLARCRVPPAQVIVEITEAILVSEGDPALHALADLNALGIGIAIDDFGTGYSALGYLRRLPVQVIKIDKSLTSNLRTEPKTLAIVEGVIQMAHRMQIKVTMEGIEDEAEAAACRGVGGDRGQGWLFGRAVPWSEAAALVNPAAITVDLRIPRKPPEAEI